MVTSVPEAPRSQKRSLMRPDEKFLTCRNDFTIPVDKNGLVIYFSVNKTPFFFNGHTGIFSDSLPEHAQEALGILSRPRAEQIGLFTSLKEKYGETCHEFLQEIWHFQNGTHPGLKTEPRMSAFTQKMNPHIFNVYLSQSCNMACRYCFNQGGTFGATSSIMSIETAEDTLAFLTEIVRSGGHEKISVNLFGGEPLLAPKAAYVLARGLQDLNNQDLKTKIHLLLSTNGTIYNREIFDVFAEQPGISTVVISLDAFKEIHDRNRLFANPGQGSSYDVVHANLKRMMRERIPYSATCIVPHPYDFVSASQKLHELGVGCTEVKELNHHIYGHKALPDVFNRDFQRWRENYIAYCDYYLTYLQTRDPIEHVDRQAIIRDYAHKLGPNGQGRSNLACGAADIKIGISAQGTLFPCEAFIEHEQFTLGDVRRGFDEEKFNRIETMLLQDGQHRLDDDSCKECFAKLICGGGCYAENFDRYGDFRPSRGAFCEFTRETVKINLYYISEMKKRNPENFSKLTGTANAEQGM
jgi:uncharacterized protein